MTYDGVEALARFARDRGIEFPLLSDSKSEIIHAFGLRNERYRPGSPAYGIAHPMLFVIDGQGIVRRRHAGRNYRERPEPDVVLDGLN